MVRQTARSRQAGFTLIELLVVLAILALLAGIAGPRVMGYLGDAKNQSAKVQMEGLRTAMNLFMLDMGRYPTAEEGLQALIDRPEDNTDRWRGPYLDKNTAIVDPWGEPYGYRRRAKDGLFEIYSLGGDKAKNGNGENADLTVAW